MFKQRADFAQEGKGPLLKVKFTNIDGQSRKGTRRRPGVPTQKNGGGKLFCWDGINSETRKIKILGKAEGLTFRRIIVWNGV